MTGVANFADINKIAIMLIRAPLKDLLKVKFRKYVLKCNFYLLFLI